MYGWRARIGFVFPSRGDTLIYEFYKIAPPGVIAVPYILNLKELEDPEFVRVRAAYQEAVRHLDWEGVDVICVCGTPPFVSKGLAGYQELAAELRRLTSRPLITGPQAELAALRASGVKNPTVITPHEPVLNDRFLEFFSAQGISPATVEGFGLRKAYEISLVHDRDLYRRTMEILRSKGIGDGIHFTCPRWATAEILLPLEQVTGVPCTSSAQAMIWSALSVGRLVPESAAASWGSLYGRSALVDDPIVSVEV